MKNNDKSCFMCIKNELKCNGGRPCNHCKENGNDLRCLGNEVILNAKQREIEENNFQKDERGNLIEIVKTPLLPPTSTLLPMPTGAQPMFIMEEDEDDNNNKKDNDKMDESSPTVQGDNLNNRRRRGRPKGSKNKKTKEQKELEEKLLKQKIREEKEKEEREKQQQMQDQDRSSMIFSSFSPNMNIPFLFPTYSVPNVPTPVPHVLPSTPVYQSLMDTTSNDLNQKKRKTDTIIPTTNPNQPPYQMLVSSSPTSMTNEILRLTQKQREMEDAILSLQMENMKLKQKAMSNNNGSGNGNGNGRGNMMETHNTNYNNNSNKVDPNKLITSYCVDKAMVVYDLHKKPPVIISATPMFYKLLNYGKEEVLGQPWHKFIDPENVENTTKKLRANTDTNLTMIQNYVRKDGQQFFSSDVHTFFYGPNGEPILDVVILHPVRDLKTDEIDPNFAIEEDVISHSPSSSEFLFPSMESKLLTGDNITLGSSPTFPFGNNPPKIPSYTNTPFMTNLANNNLQFTNINTINPNNNFTNFINNETLHHPLFGSAPSPNLPLTIVNNHGPSNNNVINANNSNLLLSNNNSLTHNNNVNNNNGENKEDLVSSNGLSFDDITFSPFYKDDITNDILASTPVGFNVEEGNDFVLESVETLPLSK